MIQIRSLLATLALVMTLCTTLIAQQAGTDIPGKKKQPYNESAPQKGLYWSVEWNGQYGGTRNYIDYTHWGIHFKGNILNRNAIHGGLGYLFNSHLYLGGGTGIEYQDRGFADYTGAASPTLYVGVLWVVPVYAELRGYFINKPTTPFLQLKMGYAASIYAAEKRHDAENSSYNNISIGVRIRNRISITLGYLFMYQPAYLTGYDQTNAGSPIINRSDPYEHYCTLGVTVNVNRHNKK